MPARGETVESVPRDRAEFGRADVDLASDAERRPLGEVFASTPVVRACRSAPSREAHDLVAFVGHLWPAATRSRHRRVVVHDGVARDQTMRAPDVRRVPPWDRDLLAVVDNDGSYDAGLVYKARHLAIVYFFEPNGTLPRSLCANVAATIVDGLGRDAAEMSRALGTVISSELTPAQAATVDLLARLCCNRRAFVLVYGRHYEDGIIVVSLFAAFYGALHPDDHVLVRTMYL